MMRKRYLNIRAKLVLMMMLVTLAALSVVFTTFIVDDIRDFRRELLNSTIASAITIGDYSVSDLTFGDEQAASGSLQKLKRNDELIAAYLYDELGDFFVSYKGTQTQGLTMTPATSFHEFKGGVLEVIEPIYFDKRYYGAVRLLVSTKSSQQRMWLHMLTMLTTIIVVFALSYFLATYLQRFISKPIIQLTHAARTVEETGNYELRLISPGDDEIGTLYKQFNAVMQQVQKREQDRDKALSSLQESEEQVRLLLDSTAEAIYGVDSNGCCTFANPACLRLLGFKLDQELLGRNMRELLLGNSADKLPHVKLTTRSRDGEYVDKQLFYRVDGSTFYAEFWAYPIYRGDDYQGTVVTFLDVTERKLAEASMRMLSGAIHQSADAVMITNNEGVIEFVNPAYEGMTGYTAQEMLGNTPRLLKSNIHDDEFYKNMWNEINSGRVFRETFMNRRKSGELYYQQQTITPLKDEHNRIIQFISTSKDVSTEIETQQRLHSMAYHDVLTGLPNRELFRDRLEHARAKADRDKTLLSVIFLDLDHFKNVNDTMGHPVGDKLLQQVAERLTGSVRNTDTVARLGGDEFTVLLESVDDLENIAIRTVQLLHVLRTPFNVEDHEVFISASVGVAVYPSDVQTIDDIFRAADTAMYRAKADGRNTYRFFTQEMADMILRRVTLEKGLHHAMDNNEFCLFYQPRVTMQGEYTICVEALIRWQHPQHGMLPPDEFIQILEETGMIVEVGAWVWRTAIAQLAQWRKQGIDVVMAVNVSPLQLHSHGLVENILSCLLEFGLSVRDIELEITEAVMMEYSQRTAQVFDAIRRSGLRMAVDDFGTGFSSLSYLKKMPIHTLKIDRSFVNDVLTDAEDEAIVTAIVSLAMSLNLNITAEGVETREQLDYLRNLGCHEAQGYYFSKPLSVDEIRIWLEKDFTARPDRKGKGVR